MRNIIDREYVESSFSYEDYCIELKRLLQAGKVTGNKQSPELVEYTRLHLHRMQRLDKTVELLPEVTDLIRDVKLPQTWIVLTEGWCGDAAQIVPILHAFSKISDKIDLRVVLRDQNPGLMDQYLTHGKSRSIPKLIVAYTHDMRELFHWGPRPSTLQHLMNEWVADEVPFEEMKYSLHLWYARDNGVTTQREIGELLANNP